MSKRPSVTGRHVSVDAAADAALARMGYKSELPRSLSMFSVLGLSFAIMAVPFGLSTTLYIPLTDGSSVSIFWGWIVISLLSLAIAASLAEICSVYPCAGGVYYWSAMLATKEWAPITSWITGWLTLVGNWTVTLSINFSGAQLILSAITLWDDSFQPQPYMTVLMFWAVMAVSFSINVFMVRYLDLFNKICIYWTGTSVIVLLVVLLVKASPNLRSGEFVFANYDQTGSGWAPGWGFFVGLLQAAYTLTGYGMVAAMCEEVQTPEREVPKAMVLSVAAAAITGVLYLIPLLFALPDIQGLLDVANSPVGQPIAFLFKEVTGSAGGGFGLLFLLLGILLFAGTGALTAASRCTYAFARDGAIPGSGLWSRIDSRFQLPLWALVLSTVVDCLLGLIYFGSTAAFNSFTGVATICLSTSYGLPILVNVLRGRRAVRHARFSLGRFGFAVNIVTICWISLAIVIFCMPVAAQGLTPQSMNYASVVFAGFACISLVWYFIRGRHAFTGPPVAADAVDVDVDGAIDGAIVGKQPSPSSEEHHVVEKTV